MIKLMKLAMAASLFVATLSANAMVVTDVESVDNWFDDLGETKSWTHDITDDGFSIGDTVNSASIAFELTDDKDKYRSEWALITINVFDFQDGGLFEIDTGELDLTVGASGVASLNADGTLFVSITSTWGDFWLGDVTLSADVTAAPASVSEPGTLALLGLGLAGLGFIRRKANV